MKISNVKYSWAKYGRVESGTESRSNDWVCQVCGQYQPDGLDPFMFEYREREFLRICMICEHIRFINDIKDHIELIHKRRRQHGFIDNVQLDNLDFLDVQYFKKEKLK